MTSDDYDFVVKLAYNRTSDPELNAQLDFLAEKRSGALVESSEDDNGSYRTYGFNDEEFSDDFLEDANLAISRRFSFEEVTAENLHQRLYWGFDEAVYHHVEFNDKEIAMRFASLFRATLSTYLDPEMYDIFVLNPMDETCGYTVVWAFPMEGVISDFRVKNGLDKELEDVFSSINVKKDKKDMVN